MTSPETRANHAIPNSPETRALRAKSTDELADILLDLTGQQIDTSLHEIIGYIPVDSLITAESVVDLRRPLKKLDYLQGESDYKNILGRLALKPAISMLLKATAIPEAAHLIIKGTRHFYAQQPGPQLSDIHSAFWDVSIHQQTWVYEEDDGSIVEVPASRTNHVAVTEYYGDSEGNVKQNWDFGHQELHDRLVFMANALASQPKED